MRWRGRGRDLGDHSLINLGVIDPAQLTERARACALDLSYRPRRNGAAARLWALDRVDFGNFNKGLLAGWGIDSRDPTADQRLIEFCLRVPEEVFVHDGWERGLARAAMSDRLPDQVAWQKLKGYQFADWHEAVAAGLPGLKDEAGRLAAHGVASKLLDVTKMRELVADWPTTGFNDTEIVRKYRGVLLRGVSTGHFVRKAGGGNQ